MKKFFTHILGIAFITLLFCSSLVSLPTAHAAITYSTQGAVAYSASAGTSVAPAYPTGIAAGDLLILVVGMKPSAANGGSVTTPSGWSPITSLTGAGGYGTTLGADTGNTNVFAYSKTAAGTETGTLTVTIGTNNVSWGQIYLLKAAAGSTWDVAGATGSDTTGNTAVSVALSSNPGVTANDYVIGALVIPTDVTTPAQFSAEAFSQTGITFGTVTEVGEPDTATGNDMGGVVFRAAVTAGTGSASPTFTATAGGTVTNVRGPGIFIRIREVASAATVTLASSGTQSTNLTSNDLDQYVGAAFTLQQNSGTADTVTAMTVSETGTAVANTTFSDATLRYETGVSTCTYNGTETIAKAAVTFNASDQAVFTALTSNIPVTLSPNFTCVYLTFDLANGATYPAGGQTIEPQVTASVDFTLQNGTTKAGTYPVALGGTTTVRPQITGYTNSTESGLNYAGSCTGCGARLGGGSGFRQTVVINGFGFGSDPGLGSRDTATNKVEVVGAATDILADDGSANTNVSAWSNTSITIRTDTTITGNADTDWGTNFGGSAALKVTAGSQAVPTNLNFFLFPQVTSITQPGGLPADSAREYDAGDADGVITLNGTRFGSAQGTGFVRILGCDSTTCSSPSGSVAVDSWSNTAVQVRVPTVIADNAYTGSIAMQQGTGGNSKTHTYGNTFRVLPRITSIVPSSGSIGDPVTINGNHFCQNGGTCPTSFDANSKVTFNSGVDATVFTSWTSTAMETQVPSGVSTGNVILKSNAFDSNAESFTISSPTPDSPTDLNQFKDSGLTQTLSTGASANAVPIYLTMTMETGVSGGTLYPQIEVKPIGTSFACSGTGSCASATEGTGVAGPGPVTCATPGNGCAISVSPVEDVYHWQARVRHNKSSVDYYSSWVSYPTGGNLESETDFKIDTNAPVITNISSGSPGSNDATITWDTTGEPSTSQVQYNTTGTFVTNCATNNDCTTLDPSLVTSHGVSLSNLNSGTMYHYRVRSQDGAGNEAISSTNTFTTATVLDPGKTTRFHVVGREAALSGTATSSSSFTIIIPETSPTIKSAYLEIRAVYDTTGSSPNGIRVAVNSETASVYVLPTGSAIKGHIKILHRITSPALDPSTNTVEITPESGTQLYALSADMVITYSYTP